MSEALLRKFRAYRAVFTGKVEMPTTGWGLAKLAVRGLFSPRAHYQLTFQGSLNRPHPPGQEVLADLRRLAGMDSGGIVNSPISRSVDPYATCYRAGLRDAYLRIVKFLDMSEAQFKETGND